MIKIYFGLVGRFKIGLGSSECILDLHILLCSLVLYLLYEFRQIDLTLTQFSWNF